MGYGRSHEVGYGSGFMEGAMKWVMEVGYGRSHEFSM